MKEEDALELEVKTDLELQEQHMLETGRYVTGEPISNRDKMYLLYGEE